WTPLLEPDEGRYADIARELLHQENWVVPHANGVPFLDKPPLVLWLAALSMKLFGASAVAVRLVPALSSILAAWTASRLARALSGRAEAGTLAALVYATAPLAL